MAGAPDHLVDLIFGRWRSRILYAGAALAAEDTRIRTRCDVARGHGHFACRLLSAYPPLDVIVFDLPEVVGETGRLGAPQLSLSDRCRYVGGDMFREVATADACILKSGWRGDGTLHAPGASQSLIAAAAA